MTIDGNWANQTTAEFAEYAVKRRRNSDLTAQVFADGVTMAGSEEDDTQREKKRRRIAKQRNKLTRQI